LILQVPVIWYLNNILISVYTVRGL